MIVNYLLNYQHKTFQACKSVAFNNNTIHLSILLLLFMTYGDMVQCPMSIVHSSVQHPASSSSSHPPFFSSFSHFPTPFFAVCCSSARHNSHRYNYHYFTHIPKLNLKRDSQSVNNRDFLFVLFLFTEFVLYILCLPLFFTTSLSSLHLFFSFLAATA